ncbi:hypothetical protein [Maricaulis sp.]|uniref:hypothetical protein n=1 Tax=Maricaulis sp. TaxID=1486257 RepID=UPI002606ACE8|nr:hypothetical protein [Maricaulis sp.]
MQYRSWLDTWLSRDHSGSYQAHGPQDGDVITGCATSYTPEEVQIFTRSLRRHHDGPAVLIVNEDAPIIEYLRDHSIDAFIVPRSKRSDVHIVTRRFAYLLSMLELKRDWGRVFTCDVRDVMFQASPFSLPVEHELEVYQEREIGTLAEHSASKKWTRRAYGADAFARIKDQPALCGGAMLGTRAALARLVRAMLNLNLIPRSAVASAFGADQAALNLAVHDGLVEAKVVANHERVSTIGAHLDALTITRDDRLVRPDGFMPPVIHQFDRDPDLTAAVERQTGLPFVTQLDQKHSPLAIWYDRRRRSLQLRLPELR